MRPTPGWPPVTVNLSRTETSSNGTIALWQRARKRLRKHLFAKTGPQPGRTPSRWHRVVSSDTSDHRVLEQPSHRGDPSVHRCWRRAGAGSPERLAAPSERRRKLLELYYADRISAEGFAEEEARIARDIDLARQAAGEDRKRSSEREQLLARFEEAAALLQDLDLDSRVGRSDRA